MYREIQKCKKERCKQTGLDKIKERYKHHKKIHMKYTMEYEQLKKEIWYNFPQWDDSLSSEDDNHSDSE